MQRYSVQMRFKRPHLNFNTLLWMTHGRRMVLFSVWLACFFTYLKPLWMEYLLKNNHIELNARRITFTHEAYMRVLPKVLTMVDIFLSLFFVAVVRELKLLFSISWARSLGIWICFSLFISNHIATYNFLFSRTDLCAMCIRRLFSIHFFLNIRS